MKTVLIFGASGTHGVGGQHGGWADKIKFWLHSQMFGADGKGELCTVYELGIPGNTARDVVGRFEIETLARIVDKNPKNIYIIFSAGTNDAKATNKPDNFLHTPDEFATNVQAFIRLAKEHAAHIICVGLVPVDQSKTNPKHSPLTNGKSYFTNQRIQRFENALISVCDEEKVNCVPLFGSVPGTWEAEYLAADGLHPNDAGHEWIFEQVQPKLKRLL